MLDQNPNDERLDGASPAKRATLVFEIAEFDDSATVTEPQSDITGRGATVYEAFHDYVEQAHARNHERVAADGGNDA